MADSQNRKVIVILGATGCGKTKLAVEICRRFNGEAISTDSMQLYRGLDIATNKVTEKDACGVPHHMMSILDPLTLGYTVVHFRNEAVKCIADIHKRGKLPVIVGGSNYYIEALLWNILVISEKRQNTKRPSFKALVDGLPPEFNTYTNEQLHEELRKVDPVEADRTLPGARRRVLRCLQYYYAKRRPISEVIEKQRGQQGASVIGVPLRYKNSIILWVQCERSTLEQRLNERLDQMLADGLLAELCEFYDRYYVEYKARLLREYNELVVDTWDKGVFQCIGLKEFKSFLKLDSTQRSMMAPGQIGRREYDRGVELIRMSSRQYASRQVKWIRNRCLASDRHSPPVYGFNSTDAEDWLENAVKPASLVVDNFLNDRTQTTVVPLPKVDPQVRGSLRLAKKCDVCEKTMLAYAWQSHIGSHAHRWNVKKRNELLRDVTVILDAVLRRVFSK